MSVLVLRNRIFACHVIYFIKERARTGILFVLSLSVTQYGQGKRRHHQRGSVLSPPREMLGGKSNPTHVISLSPFVVSLKTNVPMLLTILRALREVYSYTFRMQDHQSHSSKTFLHHEYQCQTSVHAIQIILCSILIDFCVYGFITDDHG